MKKGYLYILFSIILFSSMETALKFVAGQFNPVQLTFMRFMIGAVVLSPLALTRMKSQRLKLGFNDLLFFMMTGFICVVVSMLLYQIAILNTPASIVAILFSCNPVFVIPLAYIMLGEKIYRHTLISMMISIFGMIWIMNPFKLSVDLSGIGLTLLSAAVFSFYSVIGKAKIPKYGVVVLNCFSFFMGSIEMLLLILISHIEPAATFLIDKGLGVFARIPLTQGLVWANIPDLVYISVCVTGLGFMFYFLALQETSAAIGSVVFYIKPALAPIFAMLLLHEVITINVWLGIFFISIGSAITFIYTVKSPKLVLS